MIFLAAPKKTRTRPLAGEIQNAPRPTNIRGYSPVGRGGLYSDSVWCRALGPHAHARSSLF